MLNRRNFLKLSGSAVASVALASAPIRIFAQHAEIPERTDPKAELGYLTVENIVPGSRVFVQNVRTEEILMNIKLVESKHRIKLAIPKQSMDDEFIIRIRNSGPKAYYKPIEFPVYVGPAGANIQVQQVLDL